MTIAKNMVVAISYELREEDAQGEVVELVEQDEPFVFLFGTGDMLPEFEKQLSGLSAGDNFTFTINQDDAYGTYNESDVVALPLDVFVVDGAVDMTLLELGNILPMQTQDGQLMHGRVVEVAKDHAVLDFNHPMAGINLHFTGKVLEVRAASDDELAHGHAHGIDGHGGHDHHH